MVLIWYSKCSTCKKMKNFLDEHEIRYKLRDIMSQTPTAEELRHWHQRSGLPIRRFFNSSGDLYRSLDLKNKLDTMSESEQYDILASDPYLIRRPLLVSDTIVLVGSRIPEWEQALLS